jgi:cell wall assembly regulator SMI1
LNDLNKTLHALKNRLDKSGNKVIVAKQGNIHTVYCSLNPPIENGRLKTIQEESKLMLPEDVREVLSHQNGARFVMDSINIGGGLLV